MSNITPSVPAAAAPAPGDEITTPATMTSALQWLRLARHDLSVRTEALERLQTDLDTEQERYSALFNTAPDGYFLTDALGVIRDANRIGAAQLHIPAPQLVGKPLINYVVLEDRQNLRRRLIALQTAADKGELKPTAADPQTLMSDVPSDITSGRLVEFARIMPRHSPAFEALFRITVLLDPRTGAPSGLQWVLTDVSKRVRAETERYRLLVDAVEDYAVFLLDENGRITSWNRGAEKTFGWRKRDVLGQKYAFLFPPENLDMAEYEIRIARTEGRYPEEGWMMGREEKRFWTQGVLLSLPTGGESHRAGFAKILRDMTEKRREAEDLRLREARLSLALQAASASSWEWNLDTGELFWSSTYWEMAGLNPEKDAPSYSNWKRTVHPDDWPAVEQKFKDGKNNNAPVTAEYRAGLGNRGSETRWLLSLGQPVAGENGRVSRMVGVVLDITDRKETEAKLEARVKERTYALAQANERVVKETTARHELMQKIVTAQEDERRRISRELHDTMGQHLTAFSLNLRVLEDAHPSHAASKPILTRLRQIAAELSHDLHQMAMDLRPTALDDLGLANALQSYVENWKDRTGIKAEWGVSGFAEGGGSETVVLPPVVETTLYRIAQEALNNVARHSGAARVDVTLTCHADTVILVVEDNGRGFDAEGVLEDSDDDQKSGRLGLLGMLERAQTVGGTFILESEPGSGTSVFVRVPLRGAGRGPTEQLPSQPVSTKTPAASHSPHPAPQSNPPD